jgi:uncharacterized protein (TIGR02118 family)
MVKLIVLYGMPDDTVEFEHHRETVHFPLLQQVPGIRKIETTRITGMPIGDTRFYLLTEVYFDSKDSMDSALASKQGKAFTRDLMGFATPLVTVCSGEVA